MFGLVRQNERALLAASGQKADQHTAYDEQMTHIS